MAITHFQPTIAALDQPWFMGPSMGPKYGRILTEKFNARPDQQAIDDALALGNYLVHSEANKQTRHMTRAVLLAEFLMKNQPVQLKDQLRDQLKSLPAAQLKQKFTHLFPAFLDGGKRQSWAPANFTAVATLAALNKPKNWNGQAIPAYKLFVHTLKHPSDVLDNPIRTLSGWTAISMSVLSSTNTVCYSNHGLILSVPENNVLTTSPTDQWFDNYAGTARSTKAPGQSMPQHIGEKTVMLGGMLTPDEVVQKQGTPAAMQHFAGAAQTQHNEVVVCGVPGQFLPHGVTGQLTLLGVFIQIRMDGTLPDRYMQSQGKARDIEMAVRACATNYHVPMLYLPTTRNL